MSAFHHSKVEHLLIHIVAILFLFSTVSAGFLAYSLSKQSYSTQNGPSQTQANKPTDEKGKILGCFASGTKILMADGSEKNIEDVLPGEKVMTRERELSSKLVAAEVSKVEKYTVDQYVLINRSIKVTMAHTMFINGEWKPVALIGHGDTLITEDNNKVEVKSLSIRRGRFEVYNLKIDKYNTYIAGGVYVHD